MQIIRLETNRSSTVPQRSQLPSLMSRVEPEYSSPFSIQHFPPFGSAQPSSRFFLLPALASFLERQVSLTAADVDKARLRSRPRIGVKDLPERSHFSSEVTRPARKNRSK